MTKALVLPPGAVLKGERYLNGITMQCNISAIPICTPKNGDKAAIPLMG